MHPKPHATKIEETAALVTEWRRKVQAINTAIAKAEEVVASSEARRREHALAGSLGDVAAKRALDKIRQEDADNERALADLRLALPLAQSALDKAVQELKHAENEERNAETQRLARLRVSVAGEIDRALADIAAKYLQYEDLGKQLLANRVTSGFEMSGIESVAGFDRISGALPVKPFGDLRHYAPGATVGGGSPLALAESRYWNLPPVSEVKAA